MLGVLILQTLQHGLCEINDAGGGSNLSLLRIAAFLSNGFWLVMLHAVTNVSRSALPPHLVLSFLHSPSLPLSLSIHSSSFSLHPFLLFLSPSIPPLSLSIHSSPLSLSLSIHSSLSPSFPPLSLSIHSSSFSLHPFLLFLSLFLASISQQWWPSTVPVVRFSDWWGNSCVSLSQRLSSCRQAKLRTRRSRTTGTEQWLWGTSPLRLDFTSCMSSTTMNPLKVTVGTSSYLELATLGTVAFAVNSGDVILSWSGYFCKCSICCQQWEMWFYLDLGTFVTVAFAVSSGKCHFILIWVLL